MLLHSAGTFFQFAKVENMHVFSEIATKTSIILFHWCYFVLRSSF
jgi:hypothetical protein